MGRAMVREPRAFLMDEPLSNLDAKLRVQMRAELARLHDRLGTTTVYVTHDQVEAMTLGHRVAVLKDGVLQQVDTPQRLYKHPANLFVAAFIGSPPMNLVEATVDGSSLSFADQRIELGADAGLAGFEGRSVILGIRPSDLQDMDVWRNDDLPVIEVTAEVTEELGSEVNVIFPIDAPPVLTEDTIAAASRRRRRRHDPVDRRYPGTLPVLRPGRLADLGEAGRPGAPVGRPQPVPLLRSGDRPRRRHARGGHRRGLRPRGFRRNDRGAAPRRSHRRTGASTPRSCPPRARSRRGTSHPSASARSTMVTSPRCPGRGSSSRPVSKPLPSSETRIVMPSPSVITVTTTREADECFRALATASCAVR